MDRVAAAGAVAACVGLMVLWSLAVRAVVHLARPRLPRAPASPDLLDTPPAVVNLLARGFTGTPEAAAATLLDLAARRYVALEQPGDDPSETVVRVLRTETPGLTDYEMRVLDRVQRPPGAALPTLADLARRHADDGHEWSRRLEGEVRAEAKRLGLVQADGTSPGSLTQILGLMMAVVISCGCGPAAAAALKPDSLDLGSDLGGALTIVAIVIGALTLVSVVVGFSGTVTDDRYTREGRRVARQWGAVSRWLHAHEAFGELPPAAVTVWDRYLTYGVALAASPVAAATIDLRVGRVDLVTSDYGGRQRLVRVRYPRGKGVGGSPAGIRLLIALGGLAVLALLGSGFRDQLTDLPPYLLAGILVVPGLLAARWGYRAVRAAGDLLGRARRTGRVVRIVPFGTFGDAETTAEMDGLYRSALLRPFVRRFGAPVKTADGTGLIPGFYAVIDDGSSDTVHAWIVRTKVAVRLRAGDNVTVRVQPWSGHLVARD